MPRITADRTGYSGYSCVGITAYLIASECASSSSSLLSTSCSYGFARLPYKAEGLVTDVPWEDLGDIYSDDDTEYLRELCGISYDPFDAVDGLFIDLYSIFEQYPSLLAYIDDGCYCPGFPKYDLGFMRPLVKIFDFFTPPAPPGGGGDSSSSSQESISSSYSSSDDGGGGPNPTCYKIWYFEYDCDSASPAWETAASPEPSIHCGEPDFTGWGEFVDGPDGATCQYVEDSGVSCVNAGSCSESMFTDGPDAEDCPFEPQCAAWRFRHIAVAINERRDMLGDPPSSLPINTPDNLITWVHINSARAQVESLLSNFRYETVDTVSGPVSYTDYHELLQWLGLGGIPGGGGDREWSNKDPVSGIYYAADMDSDDLVNALMFSELETAIAELTWQRRGTSRTWTGGRNGSNNNVGVMETPLWHTKCWWSRENTLPTNRNDAWADMELPIYINRAHSAAFIAGIFTHTRSDYQTVYYAVSTRVPVGFFKWQVTGLSATYAKRLALWHYPTRGRDDIAQCWKYPYPGTDRVYHPIIPALANPVEWQLGHEEPSFTFDTTVDHDYFPTTTYNTIVPGNNKYYCCCLEPFQNRSRDVVTNENPKIAAMIQWQFPEDARLGDESY